MMIIRPTASLAKRLKLKLAATSEKSTTALGDWYCNNVILGRRHFILGVSSASRIAVLIEAAPYAAFPARMSAAINELALAIGIHKVALELEVSEMSTSAFAKTEDRSIIGSMNDYRRHLEYMSAAHALDLKNLLSVSLRLSSIPCLVMKPSFPQDAAFLRFGQAPKRKSISPFSLSVPILRIVR